MKRPPRTAPFRPRATVLYPPAPKPLTRMLRLLGAPLLSLLLLGLALLTLPLSTPALAGPTSAEFADVPAVRQPAPSLESFDVLPHPGPIPPVIRVAVGNSLITAPFLKRDPVGGWTGFSLELLQASAKAVGSQVELVELTPDQPPLVALANREVDILPVIFAGGSATPNVLTGAALLKFTPGVWVLAGQPIPASPEQLAPLKLGVQMGSPSESWLERRGLTPALRQQSRAQLAQDLLQGRVGAVVASHAGMAAELERLRLRDNFRFGGIDADTVIGSLTFGYAHHSNDAAYWLTAGIEIVGTSGRYFELYTRYLRDTSPDAEQALVSEAMYFQPLSNAGRTVGRPLKIAIEHRGAAFAPLCTPSSDGQSARGFSLDLATAIAKVMRRPVELSVVESVTAIDGVKRGEFDVSMITRVDEFQVGLVDYTRPLFTLNGALATRPGTTPPKTLQELLATRIVAVWASKGHQYLVGIGHAKFTTASNWLDAFNKLAAGEADAIAVLEPAARTLARDGLAPAPFDLHPVPEDGFRSYEAIAVRRGNQLLLWDLEDAINTLRSTGELDALYDRWYGKLAPRPTPLVFPLRSVLLGTGAALAIMLALATGWWFARRTLARRSLQLARTERAVSMLSRALPVLVHSYTVDAQGGRRTLYVSENLHSYQQTFPGYSITQPYEQTIAPLLHPDDVAGYAARAAKTRSEGVPFDYTFRLRDTDGRYRWLRSMVIGEPVAHGRIWHAVRMEVTDHQEALQRATTSEARFRAIIELAPHAAIQFYDLQGRVTAWNDASARMYGWTAVEAIGKPVGQLMLDAHGHDFFLQEIARLASGGQPSPPQEIPYNTRAGHAGTLLSTIFMLPTGPADEPPTFVCMDVDVSPARAAAQAQEQAQTQLAIALEASNTGTWIVDLNADTIVADETVIDLFGLKGRVSPGVTTAHDTFLANVAPEDRPVIAQAWKYAFNPGKRYVCQFRTRVDGTERWISGRGTLTRDPAGNPLTMLGVSVDITDLKLAEQERQQLLLARERGQRLEALGLLAGGIAHDFNNILTSVIGNAALAQRQLDPASVPFRQLEQVNRSAVFASELTQQLLTYAGRRTPVLAPIDAATTVDQTLQIIDLPANTHITITATHAPNVPHARADPVQLRQVVLNLVLNAVEALTNAPQRAATHTPTIAVTTRLVHLDMQTRADIPAERPFGPGTFVAIDVADNGPGIDPSTLARIFEPFYSTKFAGRGLGLSMVRGIIEGLSAAVIVHSTPGQGTSFTVLLPLATAPSNQPTPTPALAPISPPQTPHSGPLQGVAVLVVDDDPLVRQVICAALTSAGAHPLPAANAQEALDHLRAAITKNQPAITCAVVDLVMPETDGLATVKLLRDIEPTLPVVISSGYAAESVANDVRSLPRSTFLQKPFALDDLTAVVAATIQAHPR